MSDYPEERKNTESDYPEARKNAESDYPETRKNAESDYPEERNNAKSDYPEARKNTETEDAGGQGGREDLAPIKRVQETPYDYGEYIPKKRKPQKPEKVRTPNPFFAKVKANLTALRQKEKDRKNDESPAALKSRLKTNFFAAIVIVIALNIIGGFLMSLYIAHKNTLSQQQAYKEFMLNLGDSLSDDIKKSLSEKLLKDYVKEYYLPDDYFSLGVYVNGRARPSTVEVFSGFTENAAVRATGIILNTDGYILTNTHTVTSATPHVGGDLHNPTNTTVYEVYPVIKVAVYADILRYDAVVIDYDPESDLAIIKIDGAENLTPVVFGDSDFVKLGEETAVMGNTLGLGITVSLGSIMGTYKYNNYEMIQLDALLLEGNSGAGVFNPNCEMVGLVSFKITGLSQTGSICYAMASNETRRYIKNVNEKKDINITYTLSENIV